MSTGSNKIIKTVTIKPGENFVLPQGANVTTVIGTISSNGCTIPAPTVLQCYRLVWEEATGALEDAVFNQLILDNGQLTYTIPDTNMGGVSNVPFLSSALLTLNNPLIVVGASRYEDLDEGSNWIAKYRLPKFTVPPRVRITNPSSSNGTGYIYIEMQEDSDCTTA
jgi:hypothetical protein